jgi:hypothetical protein
MQCCVYIAELTDGNHSYTYIYTIYIGDILHLVMLFYQTVDSCVCIGDSHILRDVFIGISSSGLRFSGFSLRFSGFLSK